MAAAKKRRVKRFYLLFGIVLGIVLIVGLEIGAQKTSTDEFCQVCHVHPHSTQTWKTSPHRDNDAGMYVHCVDCHLPPPKTFAYYTEKARTGARDVYGKLFKDVEKLNWEEKSQLQNAVKYTYEASCKRCHQNLFPLGLSKEGEDAHLYYTQKEDELNCLNCHLRVGHFTREEQHVETYKIEKPVSDVIYTEPATVTEFQNFTEYIPETSVSFDLVAIPGGTFVMGSPEDEPFREEDEGPQVQVKLSPFWMGKTEVSWDEYEAFYAATSKEGRTDSRAIMTSQEVDGITGPTPPYEPPDQNWGRGSRPAITMTHHAATVYCEWLSEVTGKTYRLPTEAEWEYAARGGTQTPYFFEGSPKKYSSRGFLKGIFKPDTTTINSYVIYELNSSAQTQLPTMVDPNPFGLLNMLGNVHEFCSDWYAAGAFATYGDQLVVDPQGPDSGVEHVIRGGSFQSDAANARSAERGQTDHVGWMVTDPQMPKSLWWYSDVKDVGFRVVCEYSE